MHEIVKYFILTENQSHCFNRRFVIHSHSRSIRTGAPDACIRAARAPGSADRSLIGPDAWNAAPVGEFSLTPPPERFRGPTTEPTTSSGLYVYRLQVPQRTCKIADFEGASWP